MGISGERMQAALVRPAETQRPAHKQQIFAAAAVIALGLCAVAFVATSGDASPAEDSISNIYAGYAKQAALHRHTTKLAMGPGLEADDMKDIQTAWITFKDSKDDDVLKELTAWDPKAEEEKVQTAIDDMKDLGLETKNEGDILKKFSLPDEESGVIILSPTRLVGPLRRSFELVVRR